MICKYCGMPLQGWKCLRCARHALRTPFYGNDFDERYDEQFEDRYEDRYSEDADGDVAVDLLENLRKRDAPTKNGITKCGFWLSLAALIALLCLYLAVAIFILQQIEQSKYILEQIEQSEGMETFDEVKYQEFLKSALIVAFVCAVAITLLSVSGLAVCRKGLIEYGEWKIGKKSGRAGIVLSVITLFQLIYVFIFLSYYLFFFQW